MRWFALALEDLAAARILVRDATTALRIAGFLSQQAAEKALKAGLFEIGMSVPKIHGLNQLLSMYATDMAPAIDPDDLDQLDPWVIDGRYAADLPDLGGTEAEALISIATSVVAAVRTSIPGVERLR